MSRFDRNKISCDLSNNAYSKQIKVVNKSFKSSGVISVNGQDGEVILNYIDQLEKGIPEGVAPLNSEGIIDEQYLPPISGDNFKTINGESILGSGNIEVGNNLTFENGLREDNGVVKLGLDLNTYGTTDDGILTEDLYLIRKPIPEVPDYFVGLGIGDSSLSLSMESESYDILNIIRLSSQDIELRHSSGVRLYSNNEISLSAGSSGGLSTFAVNNSEIYYTNNVSNSANVRFTIGDGSDTYQRHIEIVATNPNWTSVTGIIMAESDKKLKIIDSWGNFGLSYSGNYSTNGKLDDRWIPDWGAVKSYVDENAGGTLQSVTTGAGNNITSNAIQITGASNVDFAQKGLVLASVPASNISQVAYALGDGTVPSLIQLTSESASIGFQGDGSDPSTLYFSEGKAVFGSPGSNGEGILYQSDYSANGKLNDRWIPDWGTVKDYVDSKASPFNLIDVIQQDYTDKAINVNVFNNTDMTYSEGSIDFGVTRYRPHTMGVYAFKQGYETTASGNYSSAFGFETTASDFCSLAFGQNTIASGNFSSAFGQNTTASGIYSSAFGEFTKALGAGSLAFGFTSTASGKFSSAFGDNSIANEYASLTIGRWSTDGPVETEWTTGSPVFKVGNGTHGGNRSNAYVLNNNGTSTQYGIASYGADYSANFTDRSLVDKAYVDNKAAEPVSDAVDETDIVVKFNQLLENMRLSGLLKT